MRDCLRVVLMLLLPAYASAQEAAFPVPDRVKVDGVPPIPMSIVDRVSPYGQFRQARLLGWHPTERRILIRRSAACPRITRSGGGARMQLRFSGRRHRRRVMQAAAATPCSETPLVARSPCSCSCDSIRSIVLTDGRSATVFRHESAGADSSPAHRRVATEGSDLWVMNPLDPGSERMIAEFDGMWDALDWSVDDKELLAQQLITGSTETRLWRIDLESGRRTLVTPQTGQPARWTEARFSADGRAVYALSDRESEVMRVWAGDLATGAWKAVTDEGVAVEAYSVAPNGALIAVVTDRGATSELQLVEAATGKRRPVPSIPPGVISNVAWHGSGEALAVEFAGARTFATSIQWTSGVAGSIFGPPAR
jgi:hypothetical protein